MEKQAANGTTTPLCQEKTSLCLKTALNPVPVSVGTFFALLPHHL